MIQTITLPDFRRAFNDYGRADQFSYEGLEVLFDHLEELEEGCGEPMELDVIALCCDFTESAIKDVLEEYDYKSLEELEDNTFVMHVNDDTVVYQSH